jgi:site-specific DNA-methyltransferase (adenine-specific)
VLKPGGHILAFSAARTYHHLAVTLEQAGFEIRDQIMWIYSSGFPKSQDIGKSIDRSLGNKNELTDRGTKGTKGAKVVKNSPGSGTLCPGCGRDSNARYSCDKGQDCGMVYKPKSEEAKQWNGWGTQLKPAHEPICLARKPIKLSIAGNCQAWGVGALNIDATRVPYADDIPAGGGNNADTFKNFSAEERTTKDQPKAGKRTASFHNATGGGETQPGGDGSGGWEASNIGRFPSNVLGEIPEYQKYFYCPKVSRRERHIGFDDPGPMFQGSRTDIYQPNKNSPDIQITSAEKKDVPQNNHPTVKPIELMKYLIKLVTPAGGSVLDPFNGSGSTGCAAVELDYDYIGIELDPAYVDIAERRIAAWYESTHATTFDELFETC